MTHEVIFVKARFQRSRDLEGQLGDPFDPQAAINHALSARWDEEEHYPQEALDVLNGFGVSADFVPTIHGGDLRGYDELIYLARLIAGRNLSIAVTMSAMVWSTLAWIAADEKLQKVHAASILANRTPCLAYSEESHGADLLASDTVARRVPEGYRISGRKWPINRATTGQSVMLLARTGAANDPRGLSLFWFEKADIDPARFKTLPRVPTLGVRGCDISGIEFDDVLVPESNRIGPEGFGLETALKGFHVTRTLCAGLSLGAVDAALRTTVRLARSRRLYGAEMIALPHVRRTLVDAYALLQAVDAASLAAARLLHVSPTQSATISAAAKHGVPHIAERIVGQLATIHGARFYMRDHHDWGLMQKVYRDNLLIGIFDGSSPVNLHALSTQLSLLARYAPSSLGGGSADVARESVAAERATQACSLEVDPPLFDGSMLELASRGSDDILNSFGVLLGDIERTLEPGTFRDLLLPQLQAVKTAIARLYAEILANDARRRGGMRSSAMGPAMSDAAGRYAMLFVTVAAVHVWWRHPETLARGRTNPWILLAVRQLLEPDLSAASRNVGDFDSSYNAVLEDLLARSGTPHGYFLA